MESPMVPRKAPSFLALAIVALLVSSSFASRNAPVMAPANGMVIHDGRPRCEVMVPCNVPKCTQYCLSTGVTLGPGFCTFKPDFQFYCCCPVLSA